jgi:hypothetical protein
VVRIHVPEPLQRSVVQVLCTQVSRMRFYTAHSLTHFRLLRLVGKPSPLHFVLVGLGYALEAELSCTTGMVCA